MDVATGGSGMIPEEREAILKEIRVPITPREWAEAQALARDIYTLAIHGHLHSLNEIMRLAYIVQNLPERWGGDAAQVRRPPRAPEHLIGGSDDGCDHA